MSGAWETKHDETRDRAHLGARRLRHPGNAVARAAARDLMILLGGAPATGGCAGTERPIDRRTLGDGSTGPFTVPAGKVLVLTGVEWFSTGTGTGRSVLLTVLHRTPLGAQTLFTSHAQSTPTGAGYAGEQSAIPHVVVKPGVPLCVTQYIDNQPAGGSLARVRDPPRVPDRRPLAPGSARFHSRPSPAGRNSAPRSAHGLRSGQMEGDGGPCDDPSRHDPGSRRPEAENQSRPRCAGVSGRRLREDLLDVGRGLDHPCGPVPAKRQLRRPNRLGWVGAPAAVPRLSVRTRTCGVGPLSAAGVRFHDRSLRGIHPRDAGQGLQLSRLPASFPSWPSPSTAPTTNRAQVHGFCEVVVKPGLCARCRVPRRCHRSPPRPARARPVRGPGPAPLESVHSRLDSGMERSLSSTSGRTSGIIRSASATEPTDVTAAPQHPSISPSISRNLRLVVHHQHRESVQQRRSRRRDTIGSGTRQQRLSSSSLDWFISLPLHWSSARTPRRPILGVPAPGADGLGLPDVAM